MMSLFRPNSPRRGRRGLVIATIVVIILVAVDVLSEGRIRAVVRAGGTRVWSVGSQSASLMGGSEATQNRSALVAENEALKQEIARLELRVATLKSLEDENKKLRDIVRLAQTSAGVTAPIVSSFLASPYGTFTVGAGARENVTEGDLVMASDGGGRGFVIGRVSEISDRLALVMQIFAPDISTEAVIKGVPVVVEGRGGGNARAEVPSALPIAEGDTVVAPRFRGMPIGIVSRVSRDPASAHQTVYVGLPVNLATLQFVYVVSQSQ